MHKIFISHSSKDKKIVDILVDKILQNGMGFNHTEIFCTSIEGLGIKTGEDWRNYIKENLLKAKVIILLITPNYIESEMCLAEIGASWTSEAFVVPIIVPPLRFEDSSIIYKVRQGLNLTVDKDIDTLRDDLKKYISIEQPPTALWTAKKKEGLLLIEKTISENPFNKPLLREEFDKTIKELSETKQTIKIIVEEKQSLEEYCKKLEKAKDKIEVCNIKKELGLTDEYTIFIKKSKEIGNKINSFPRPIRKLMFNYLSGKAISLSSSEQREYKQQLEEAYADGLIDEEYEININHKKIFPVINLWNDYEILFNELNYETIARIDEDYPDVEIGLDNLSFWQEILEVRI